MTRSRTIAPPRHPDALDQFATGRARTGPKPRAGVTSSETLRFRCSPAERARIEGACLAAGRDLSDVARELLLAWARRTRGDL